MSNYRITRILVPVDGSEYSRYAADHAVRLAQPHGAEVIFLHVVDEHIAAELGEHAAFDGDEQAQARLAEHGTACLRQMAHLAEARGVPHREILLHGDPANAVCATATRETVDVIIVGKLGRHGSRRILMGSITRRVIESTDRPVLVVTGPPSQKVFGPDAATVDK